VKTGGEEIVDGDEEEGGSAREREENVLLWSTDRAE
jgi:hypothetical protein